MNPVAQYLAARFRSAKAGRTGSSARDLIIVCKDLLAETGCRHGPALHAALRELDELERLGIVLLERHRRDPSAILKVRLPLERAHLLFHHLGETAPHEEREALAQLFHEAERYPVPAPHAKGWQAFCAAYAEAAQSGRGLHPFDRSAPQQIRDILAALPAILAWESESHLRFASSILFGDSKRLEALRSRIETCLRLITGQPGCTLADFGILEHERTLLLHGPLTLTFPAGSLDLALLDAPVRLSASDLRRASLSTPAPICLTVENAAMLHELAKRRCGILLASSGSEGGFANAAVITFLRALPASTTIWHFGDSDPKGFDILADLRQRSGLPIHSLHMRFRPAPQGSPPLAEADHKTIARLLDSAFLTAEEKSELRQMQSHGTKGLFEQESLGHPGPAWPFYRDFSQSQ